MLARSLSLLAVLCAFASGCGDSEEKKGPYGGLPLGRDRQFPDLQRSVHVARDRYGIAHVTAESYADLGFAQGYVMAHDRLPQMDVLRRIGAGELAELFGIEPSTIDSDLNMRQHRMKPLATAAWAELTASSDPGDRDIVALLEGFTAGINAYAAELLSGGATLSPAFALSFSAELFRPWSPIDSLVLGRFQAYLLSYSADSEIHATRVYQEARKIFDQAVAPGQPEHVPARFARRGAAQDLYRLAPIGRVSVAEPVPTLRTGPASAALGGPKRPDVPASLLALVARKLPYGLTELGGSNSWVVGPNIAGGNALLAGDQHLSLTSPSIFYPTHLSIAGVLDVSGVTFPGVPGVVLGHNGRLAWSSTTVYHDVNDVYLERVVPCDAGGSCVLLGANKVPIETWEEEIKVGFLGAINRVERATYERVPHHGPIIPNIQGGKIMPRTEMQALSVRYTGHEVTNELRAFYRMANSSDVEGAFEALRDFRIGGQNWLLADNRGRIGWSTQARVPRRPASAMRWHPTDNPDGTAPFHILPGDGSSEWEGYLEPHQLPQALNPLHDFIATANSDPWGTTFDGNPLNEAVLGQKPYVGGLYTEGLRTERITELVREGAERGKAHSLESMAAIQTDSQSAIGGRLRPHISAVLAAIAKPRQPDAARWLATLTPERQQALVQAGARLAAWSLKTPPAIDGPGPSEIVDSSATTLFNVWVHFFMKRAFNDEYNEIGYDVGWVGSEVVARLLVALFAEPDSLATGRHADTGQPLLCDDMKTAEAESCDRMVLEALDLALAWLKSAEGYGSADMDSWRWGKIHRLRLSPIGPTPELAVPSPEDDNASWRGGYPTAGDNWGVMAANGGYEDLNFDYGHAAAQRVLIEVPPGGRARARLQLPGGVIADPGSPHFRDLADRHYVPQVHFDVPYTTAEVNRNGEERWQLGPRQ